MDSFQQTKYDDDICNAISFPDGTGNSTRICFKKAKGGHFYIWGLWSNSRTCHRPIFHESRQARQGTDSYLAAERSVWFVNYKLSGRGSKQLAATSSAQVKAKSADLPENRPSGSFRDYSRISMTKMPDRPIISSWNTKEEELKKQAMENKENADVEVDRWRNKDNTWTLWAEHKSVGLPFGRANLMFILQILKLFRLWPTYFLKLITHCRQKSLLDLNFTTYGTFLW